MAGCASAWWTGATVNFAKVPVPPIYLAGGKWNSMEIAAQGAAVTVKLNGTVTTALQDSKFPSGPFALQFGSGVKMPWVARSSGAK